MAGRRGLLSIGELSREELLELLHLSSSFAEVAKRAIPRVPALRGKTVATLFFENSTRTRLSFEMAAKRLSADTMTFAAATSSMQKGESLRDTVETIDAMGVDAMVVRHAAAGAPARVASWVRAQVINAGDGQHEHPSQALLDCYTLREALVERKVIKGEDLCGVRVAIVGDARHSRVVRSEVAALSLLGAEVTLVAPSTLLPASLEGWPVKVSHDLDDVLSNVEVCYVLRLQAERMKEALVPSEREYVARFGLSDERAARLSSDAVIMHPGPMIRGLEISAEVASSRRAVVTDQVRNGVAVRMAILFSLLATPDNKARPQMIEEAE